MGISKTKIDKRRLELLNKFLQTFNERAKDMSVDELNIFMKYVLSLKVNKHPETLTKQLINDRL